MRRSVDRSAAAASYTKVIDAAPRRQRRCIARAVAKARLIGANSAAGAGACSAAGGPIAIAIAILILALQRIACAVSALLDVIGAAVLKACALRIAKAVGGAAAAIALARRGGRRCAAAETLGFVVGAAVCGGGGGGAKGKRRKPSKEKPVSVSAESCAIGAAIGAAIDAALPPYNVHRSSQKQFPTGSGESQEPLQLLAPAPPSPATHSAS